MGQRRVRLGVCLGEVVGHLRSSGLAAAHAGTDGAKPDEHHAPRGGLRDCWLIHDIKVPVYDPSCELPTTLPLTVML